MILQDILWQLFPDDEGNSTVTNFSEFVSKLKRTSTNEQLVIVLADAEQLRGLGFNLLPGFMRLQALAEKRNLTVVFVSKLPWKKWEIEGLNSPPITLNFPPYSKQQKVQLLTEYLVKNHDLKSIEDDDEKEAFFTNFSDVILGTFHAVCRSLPQFISVAKMVLPKYAEPVEDGQVEASNSRSLYRHAEPYLKECLMTANLKENSSGSLESTVRLNVELPFYSKFLLISAYIASYNPASSDKRFFMKSGGKIKKMRNTVAAAAKIAAHKRSSQLLGPKLFPMDRMLAIFYVIVDTQGVHCSSEILTQISSLVSLGLLTQVGNHCSLDTGLDSPKFKCNVGLDFIRLVSKNVRFEIHNYLYDLQSQ